MHSSFMGMGSYEPGRKYATSSSYGDGSSTDSFDVDSNRSYTGPTITRKYPPIHLPPVKPYPPDPFIDQYPLPEALRRGTLYRWLYDPYENPYE